MVSKLIVYLFTKGVHFYKYNAIEYDDGSRQVFSTDESWQVSTSGAYTVAGLYEGVCFDARKSISDIPWKNADKADWKYHPGIRPTYGVLAHRQEILKPVEMHPSKRGGTIYDFGQNCSAVICLDIKNAKAGQQILVRHAEILLDGELFTSNLRKAEATVHYICRDGRQFFTPELTTMGFRYVRVQGIEPEDLTITAQVVSSLDAPTGGFACSNERLNQLQSNIQWGARSNFVDIPTDCPQRDERMGWTGDIAVFAEESPPGGPMRAISASGSGNSRLGRLCFPCSMGTVYEKRRYRADRAAVRKRSKASRRGNLLVRFSSLREKTSYLEVARAAR